MLPLIVEAADPTDMKDKKDGNMASVYKRKR